jgi:hypothetical protein
VDKQEVSFGIEQRIGYAWQRLNLRMLLRGPNEALDIAQSYNAPDRYRAVRYVTTTEVITQREQCSHCFCIETTPPKCCQCGARMETER